MRRSWMMSALGPRYVLTSPGIRRSMDERIGYARCLVETDRARSLQRVAEQNALGFEWPECPRCGSAAARHVLDGRDYLYGTSFGAAVSECARCGLWYHGPRL